MPTKIVLDANIFLKLLLKEKDSILAENLFEALLKNNTKILEPNFVEIEVYSVIRRNIYFGKLSYAKAELVLGHFS